MKCIKCLKEKDNSQFSNYEPEYCCEFNTNWQENPCGCMGYPINPPICNECEEELRKDDE